MATPTPTEEFFFDLHGFRVLEGALDADDLLARLTPEQRQIVQPIVPRRPPPPD